MMTTLSNDLKFHTIDSLTDTQREAINAIPNHDDAESPSIESTISTAMFLDEGHFDREKEKIFRKLPVATTLSAVLNEPNMYVTHDGYGLPLLLTRDKTGKAHAFLNVCTHKGALLTDNCDAKKGGRISCPFHAWTFDLGGELIGIPRNETFENLDKKTRNLIELPSKEAGGILWVILDKDAEPDFSLITKDIIADMDALEIGKQYLYGRKRFDLNGNWKQIIEPFLEGYHVQRLHAKSVGPLFADVPNVVNKIGDHICQTSGKADFTPEQLEVEGKKNIHKLITHAYLLFPNTIVVTSPYYMSVMIIMPSEVGKTKVDYHMLTLNPANTPEAEVLYKLSYDTVLDVFGNEDFAVSETCYTGLKSGALDDLDIIYSGLEACIPMQNATIDKYMSL